LTSLDVEPKIKSVTEKIPAAFLFGIHKEQDGKNERNSQMYTIIRLFQRLVRLAQRIEKSD
jgi:hypothetical protein